MATTWTKTGDVYDNDILMTDDDEAIVTDDGEEIIVGVTLDWSKTADVTVRWNLRNMIEELATEDGYFFTTEGGADNLMVQGGNTTWTKVGDV